MRQITAPAAIHCSERVECRDRRMGCGRFLADLSNVADKMVDCNPFRCGQPFLLPDFFHYFCVSYPKHSNLLVGLVLRHVRRKRRCRNPQEAFSRRTQLRMWIREDHLPRAGLQPALRRSCVVTRVPCWMRGCCKQSAAAIPYPAPNSHSHGAGVLVALYLC